MYGYKDKKGNVKYLVKGKVFDTKEEIKEFIKSLGHSEVVAEAFITDHTINNKLNYLNKKDAVKELKAYNKMTNKKIEELLDTKNKE